MVTSAPTLGRGMDPRVPSRRMLGGILLGTLVAGAAPPPGAFLRPRRMSVETSSASAIATSSSGGGETPRTS